MALNTKVGKLSFKIWFVIFLALQIFLIVLMIGCLLTKKWVKAKNVQPCAFKYVDTTYDDYYDYYVNSGDITTFCGEFKGSLQKCQSGCDDSYQKQYEDWCKSVSGDYYCVGCDDDTEDAACKMFQALFAAEWVFIALEIVVIILIVCWALAMYQNLKHSKHFKSSYCISIIGCVTHYIGSIAWFSITGAGVGDNCGGQNRGYPVLCATDGPSLAIVIMVFFPLIVAGYLVFLRFAKKILEVNEPKVPKVPEVPETPINKKEVSENSTSRIPEILYVHSDDNENEPNGNCSESESESEEAINESNDQKIKNHKPKELKPSFDNEPPSPTPQPKIPKTKKEHKNKKYKTEKLIEKPEPNYQPPKPYKMYFPQDSPPDYNKRNLVFKMVPLPQSGFKLERASKSGRKNSDSN